MKRLPPASRAPGRQAGSKTTQAKGLPFAWVVLSHGIPLFLVIPHSHVIPRYDAVLHVIPRYDAVLHVILRCDAVLYVIPHLMRNPGILAKVIPANGPRIGCGVTHANGPRIAVRGDPV